MARCMKCMEDGVESDRCVACGSGNTAEPLSQRHLKPGTALKAGRYLIGQALNAGGFGVVYIAWDKELDVKRAIKEYLPVGIAERMENSSKVVPASKQDSVNLGKGIELFRKEGRTLARLEEEERGATGFVKIYDVFEENGTAYLVMEYLDGLTLEAYLDNRKDGKVGWETAMKIMEPIFATLELVHRRQIYHRDVAPDNIFLTKDGYVKLIDFGAAKQFAAEASRSMDQVYKPGYSPPEQYEARGKFGPWTDVYALAATLYRSVTGKAPPEAPARLTGHEELAHINEHSFTISRKAKRAIFKALSLDTAKRFQSVGDFLEALNKPRWWAMWREKLQAAYTRVVQGIGGLMRRWLLPLQRRLRNWKHYPLMVPAAIVLSAVVVGAIYVMRHQRTLPPPASTNSVPVKFNTSPTSASVQIGGKICLSPCALSLAPGRYELRVTKDGYSYTPQTLDVNKGMQTPIQLALQALPLNLRVEFDSRNGRVRLDAETEQHLTDFQFNQVMEQTGPHVLRMFDSTGAYAKLDFDTEPGSMPSISGLRSSSFKIVIVSSVGGQARLYSSPNRRKVTLDSEQFEIDSTGVNRSNLGYTAHPLIIYNGKVPIPKSVVIAPAPALTVFLISNPNTVKPQVGQPNKNPQSVTPTLASLMIENVLPGEIGAQVFLDGTRPLGMIKPDGSFPNAQIPEGSHYIELRTERYDPSRSAARDFHPGTTTALEGSDFTMIEREGKLTVNTDPHTDNVIARGVGNIQVPISSGGTSLLPGHYRVTATWPSGRTKRIEVVVAAGRQVYPIPTLSPKVIDEKNWEKHWNVLNCWTPAGPWFECTPRKGGGQDIVLFTETPSVGTFSFSLGLAHKGRSGWVLNYVDRQNYILFQIDSKSLSARQRVNGKWGRKITQNLEYTKKEKDHPPIGINVTRDSFRVYFYDSGKTLYQQSIKNRGKFGLLVPKDGTTRVAHFRFRPD